MKLKLLYKIYLLYIYFMMEDFSSPIEITNFVKLQGKNKKFDQRLYDKYDQPAREIVKRQLGDVIKDNQDIYGEDLVIDDTKCKYKYIELQVCTNWIGGDYPYELPFVYERKGHFSKNTLFIILNYNMAIGLLFDKGSLNSEPVRLKPYSRTYVYQVPWRKVIKFQMDHLNMDLINMY
jgi:hypothetical protein